MFASSERSQVADKRRRLAELRVSYGNALSDCNLKRMRTLTPEPEVSTFSGPQMRCDTRGHMSNAYSWQLSSSYTPRLAVAPLPGTKLVVQPPPTPPPHSSNLWVRPLTQFNVAKRYEILQKRAQESARLMEEVQSRREGQTPCHRVKFKDN